MSREGPDLPPLTLDPLLPPKYCPQCVRVGVQSRVKKFKVDPASQDLVIMCKNDKCPWPFSVKTPEEVTVRDDQQAKNEICQNQVNFSVTKQEDLSLLALKKARKDHFSSSPPFANNGSGSSNNTEEDPIVLSSDTEGYSTDGDDHDDPIGVDEYLSDDQDQEDRSSAKKHAGNLRLNYSIFSNLGGIFTPPRPPATTSAPVMRQTTTTSSLSSTSPPVWTHPPTSTTTSPLVKKKPVAPVMVTLSSDSEDQNFLVGGVGTKDWPQYLDKDKGCLLATRSIEVEVGIKRFLSKEDEYADVDELLTDTTDVDENKNHELDFNKSKILQCTAEDDKPAKAEGSNAPGNEGNNNHKSHKPTDTVSKVTNENVLKIDDGKVNSNEAKHESRLEMHKKRPSRWNIPPPGLILSQLSAPPPPVHNVAQVPIPSHLRGLLLGKGGRFINKMRVLSGAAISLGPVYCTIEGSSGGVGVAREMIADKLRLRMF